MFYIIVYNVYHILSLYNCAHFIYRSRSSSNCPQCSADVSALMTQSSEYNTLSVEKDRLLELVQVLQTK